jgi:hypothetical protein
LASAVAQLVCRGCGLPAKSLNSLVTLNRFVGLRLPDAVSAAAPFALHAAYGDLAHHSRHDHNILGASLGAIRSPGCSASSGADLLCYYDGLFGVGPPRDGRRRSFRSSRAIDRHAMMFRLLLRENLRANAVEPIACASRLS